MSSTLDTVWAKTMSDKISNVSQAKNVPGEYTLLVNSLEVGESTTVANIRIRAGSSLEPSYEQV